jgi:hypothetical protein
MLDKCSTSCYNKGTKTKERKTMFNIFKKKSSVKYLVHHITTSDIYTIRSEEELENVLKALGEEAEIIKL